MFTTFCVGYKNKRVKEINIAPSFTKNVKTADGLNKCSSAYHQDEEERKVEDSDG
jgi:hypothetical protein